MKALIVASRFLKRNIHSYSTHMIKVIFSPTLSQNTYTIHLISLPFKTLKPPPPYHSNRRQSYHCHMSRRQIPASHHLISGTGVLDPLFFDHHNYKTNVKRMFAHCLDGVNGGGIFAIGHVVQPKVNSTPLIPDEIHYTGSLVGIEVGTQFLNLSTNTNDTVSKKRTIIDSGTTLAYLPDAIYKPLVNEIVAGQRDLRLRTLHDQYTCFEFSGSVDDGFPAVTFYFENSLSLNVYPHDYLFAFEDNLCFGRQNNGLDSLSSTDTMLLGDLVLSNKLVLYDLENQTIGWTEYNCYSRIKLRDEIMGSVHLVGPHSLPSASSRNHYRYLISFLLIALIHLMIS